jgi:predicted Zn-dependent peptidase
VSALPADDGSTVRRTVLPGGLRVVTETLPAVRSVALGIWVGVGSRDEDVRHEGATHYLEHLLFKGTKRRTALDISAEMDAVGGEMNAFTTKEYTCYYARVLDADLPLATDILSDMVTSSLISPQDVDAERNVVLEEIAMNDDDPTDTVHEAFTAQLFGDTPLGRPVLGTVESINAITRDQIFEHYRARYSPDHLVVAAAGSLDHDDLVARVADAFARHDVSIRAARQEARGDDAQLIIVSHQARDAALAATVSELESLDAVRAVASVMRVEGEEGSP